MLWHGQSVAVIIFCRRGAESDVTVMPSVTCMDYVGDIITPLMQFPLLQHWLLLPTWEGNIDLHHLVQSKESMKDSLWWRESRCIMPTWKGERLLTYGRQDVRFAHVSIRTIRDNVDSITGSAKSGTKVFVLQDYHHSVRRNCTKHKNLHFLALEINKYTIQKCICTVHTVHTYSTGSYVH